MLLLCLASTVFIIVHDHPLKMACNPDGSEAQSVCLPPWRSNWICVYGSTPVHHCGWAKGLFLGSDYSIDSLILVSVLGVKPHTWFCSSHNLLFSDQLNHHCHVLSTYYVWDTTCNTSISFNPSKNSMRCRYSYHPCFRPEGTVRQRSEIICPGDGGATVRM